MAATNDHSKNPLDTPAKDPLVCTYAPVLARRSWRCTPGMLGFIGVILLSLVSFVVASVVYSTYGKIALMWLCLGVAIAATLWAVLVTLWIVRERRRNAGRWSRWGAAISVVLLLLLAFLNQVNHRSLREEIRRVEALFAAGSGLQAGQLDGIECSWCGGFASSIWFTQSASGRYSTWLICRSCGHRFRSGSSDYRPHDFRPERLIPITDDQER